MDYVEIAKTEDISEGNMKAFIVSGKDILVSKYQGKYYAIDNKCTHMKGELAQGKIEGKIVTCPKHGSKFDITTGKCLSGAKVLFMTMKTKDEPVYEVKVEGSSIKVGL
jgi:3-phenylpropionate/trans-cinnamate dioxygenase ferredoxin subunit